MKKKLFLITLMVALFACIFAISISAEGFVSDYTEEVTELGAGPDWADLGDKDATAVLKKADGTYIRIPLYYIYQANGSNQLRHEIQTTTGRTGFRYDWIGEQLDEEFTHESLVALDIPEGIKTTSGLNNYKALKEVVFPLSATGLPKSENHPTLEKVFVKQSREADGTVKGITTVSDYAFKNAKAVAYFKFQLDYTTYIGDCAFMNCAVKELRFEGPMTGMKNSLFGGCSKLETIYINNTSATRVKGGQIFSGNSVLKNVVLNGVELPDYTFQNINGLTEGGMTIVATNVGTVGQMAFKNVLNISNATLSGVTSIGNGMFLNCTNLKTVDISGPITTVNNIFSNCPNVESAIVRVIGNPFPDATSVGGITSIVSKDVYEADKDTYKTGKHFVYGYNLCELLYGGAHVETDDVVCTFVDENGKPTDVKFLSTFKVSSPCGRNCGEENIIKTIDPLFICKGYSASITGNVGIVLGFQVNNEAIDEYTSFTGEEIRYGVFAASQEKLDGGNIFENGIANENVVCAEIKATEFSAFEIKVIGIADDKKDVLLALGAYVAVTKDESTEYSYMQATDKGEKTGNYYFVSYNDIVK